jgi:FEZ-like protein
MRDLANKMAELKFEAPLAQFEETDEWGPVDYQSTQVNNLKAVISDQLNLNSLKDINTSSGLDSDNDVDNQFLENQLLSLNDNNNDSVYDKKLMGGKIGAKTTDEILASATSETHLSNNVQKGGGGGKDNVEFAETFSGSLEDLVNTFDEKITKCFGNYEQSLEDLAPVQVRTQEEIMNECQ